MNRREFMVFVPAVAAASVHVDTNVTRIRVKNTQDLLRVQALAGTPRALANAANTAMHIDTIIQVEPGTYVLQDTLRIMQSNFAIISDASAKVILADHVNKPVLAIGSQEENPSYTVENVYISGLVIDGNKENQDFEFDTSMSWIRNNGIDVRSVNRLLIDRVKSGNNRSGGLVVSWGSSDIYVFNAEFDNNFFDGLAYYDSKRIYSSNVSMKSNRNAGISLDNGLSDSGFSHCLIDSNGDVGIFARNSKRLRFNNCGIYNSGSYAAFLAHDESGNGVQDTMFSCCQILGNRGGILMASVSEEQSSFNSVVSSVFRGNAMDGRINIESAGSRIWQSGNIEMV